jgi:hypothetical protein
MKVKLFISTLGVLFVLGSAYPQESGKENYRDPFLSILPEDVKITDSEAQKRVKDTPPPVAVNGILWNSDNPQAIIDGGVYSVGDKLIGLEAQVFKIRKNTVFISYGDKIFEMKTKKEEK